MFINTVLVAGALVSVAAAVPLHQPLHHPLHMHLHKRDVVWTTKIVEEIVTVPVTVTVTGQPGGVTPGSNLQHRPDFGRRPQRTSHVFQTITVQPQPAPPAASAPPAAPPAPAPAPSQPAAPAPPPAAPSQPVAPAPSQPAPPVPDTQPAPSQPAAPAPPPQPAPSAAPQPPSTGGGGGGPFTGDITYYTPGLGSCGQTNTESDMIVALAAGMMEAAMASSGIANPNENPLCGKTITISHGGKTAQATIVDTCPGCSGASLDLTPSLFEVFGQLGEGRISGVQWSYN